MKQTNKQTFDGVELQAILSDKLPEGDMGGQADPVPCLLQPFAKGCVQCE